MVAKIWPVYRWDTSPPIFTLMVPREAALEEMNYYGEIITESELDRALRDCNVLSSLDATGDRLKAKIKAFYDARKDRRTRKGYTPSDTGENVP